MIYRVMGNILCDLKSMSKVKKRVFAMVYHRLLLYSSLKFDMQHDLVLKTYISGLNLTSLPLRPPQGSDPGLLTKILF